MISIDSLILEVTRRCNMSCEHCLRGCSQNIDMTKEIVDKTFENISAINHITFTGGEPFLNLDIIKYVLEVVKEKDIPVYGFYLVTNGKYYDDEQIIVMKDWFLYVMQCNYGNYPSFTIDDIYFAGLCVSKDNYHEEIPIENYLAYRSLFFYKDDKEISSNETFDKRILNEGNASINGIGVINRKYQSIEVEIENDIVNYNNPFLNDYNIIDYLYISANGNICGDCDMSYEHIDEFSDGNILDTPLVELLLDIYCHINEKEAI